MQLKNFEKSGLISFKGAFAKLLEIQSKIVAEMHRSRTQDLIFSIFKLLSVSLLVFAAILNKILDFSKARLVCDSWLLG